MAEFRKREDITQEIDILQTWSEMGAPKMGDLEPNLASLVKSVDLDVSRAEPGVAPPRPVVPPRPVMPPEPVEDLGGAPPAPPEEPPSPYADLPPGDDDERPSRGGLVPLIAALLLVGAGAAFLMSRWEPFTAANRPAPSPGKGTATGTLPHGTPESHPTATAKAASPEAGRSSPEASQASPEAAHASPAAGHGSPEAGHASPSLAMATPGSHPASQPGGTTKPGARPPSAHPGVIAAVTQPPRAVVRTYQVRTGDSLSAIARDQLGDMDRWQELYAANQDTVADPDVIHPGEQLKLPETPTYTVKPGDTLKAIAAAKLGSADRWREIYELNRAALPSPGVVPPGTQLKLPADAAGTAPTGAGPGLGAKTVKHHTVQQGDSLSLLARRYLGSESRWHEIYYANSHKIANPTGLFPGQVLAIPAAQQRGRFKYVVKAGDCLWAIAGRELGQPLRWTRIYEANRAQIRNPHWIYPGQVFRIP
jgi:nucleoid-associated protein YgaU